MIHKALEYRIMGATVDIRTGKTISFVTKHRVIHRQKERNRR